MSKTNHCIELAAYPDGIPDESHFRSATRPMPTAGDGEFVVRNVYLSLDPFLRGVISGRQIYATKLEPGDVMVGNTVSVVVDSKHPDFAAGDIVTMSGGWQEFSLSSGDGVRHVGNRSAPLSLQVGILGMPGLTAYAGLLHTARPVAGETVVVSAAAGPVGSMVGQLARLHGCRTVGIAGSDEKCRTVTHTFGFDACINYKNESLPDALADACPDGIDVYFDNVGGPTLAAVLGKLALGARITLCGLMTQYNEKTPPPGPNLGPVIGARATMTGFVVYDHYDKWNEFQQRCGDWVADGSIRFLEDRADGLDAAPAHFARLMRGQNFGKALVVIGPEPD
ncbi:MAG: NADP-dependent oxidoreductase [Pseudomonadota bacterium]